MTRKTVERDGEPLFLAQDVANWIDHTNSRMMLESVDDDEKVVRNAYTLGGIQETWFLTEKEKLNSKTLSSRDLNLLQFGEMGIVIHDPLERENKYRPSNRWKCWVPPKWSYLSSKYVKFRLYQNCRKALTDHVDEEDKLNNESLSSLGQRGGWLINESGLYSLILYSPILSSKLAYVAKYHV